MYEHMLKIKVHAIFKKLAEDKYSYNKRDEVIHEKSKEDEISIVLYDMLKSWHSCRIGSHRKPSEVFKQEKLLITHVFSMSR